MASPGILYVTAQPHEGLSPDEFHDWYNNEHGPTRLRLPQIFSNGLRYRATDGAEPHFLATYDVTAMSHLETETYKSLRERRSPREADTIGQVDVERYFYDLLGSRQAPLFVPVEQLTESEAAGIALLAVELTLADAEGGETSLKRWFEEEHIAMLAKIPGWRRTRLFRTSTVGSSGSGSEKPAFLALHDYAKDNGLDSSPEYKAAEKVTKWKKDVFSKHVAHMNCRVYELFYVFGPAPREQAALARLPASKAWTSPDGKTKTTPGGPGAAIASTVTAADGLEIPYRLEGNPSPGAPTVAFVNSLLTSLEMWDPLVGLLRSRRADLRILRYDARGRHALPDPPQPATLEMLADDLAVLLRALRIDKLHALVGVSMGGATVLKFVLRYPDRVDRFVACDFNAASSASNTQAWKDRIEVAEGPGSGDKTGMQMLARQTVERWFHPHTVETRKDIATWMTDMIAGNNVQGFKHSCQALWDYDMKEETQQCRVPGLLVVGEGDAKGALVKAMAGFHGSIGEKGVELKVVPEAGHLPMVENPEGFWQAIQEFI